MTETQQENGQYVFETGPPMVPVSEDGAAVPLEVASRALIWIGKNSRSAFRDGMAWAMLGDK